MNDWQQNVLDQMLREVEILTDAERLERTMGKLIGRCIIFIIE